ncbi:alpha/beta hydrolase [Actinomyces faecalis]|uniref:alpha/beta hydrolase n=1 Tax=Actinomyces faecalis TaxID=2722820 RepID=UPI001557CF6B|nr:alpha/beta fold hydrolase [Actinomyces faecalis]
MSASTRLRTSPWTTSVAGLFSRDLHLRVPLDRSGDSDTLPDGSRQITVYAREVARRQAGDCAPSDLPALVFLQGGPGCESPRPAGDGGAGWLGAVLEHYRVILLDQRGTGASTPIDHPDAGGDAQGTARLLTHFRADEIVEDCEDLRRELGIERWSLLGQSFGGFCTIRYASAHPDSLETIYLTGGLPAVGRSIDEVYSLTYEAMQAKSEEHYRRYPGDRETMARLAELAGRGGLMTSNGEPVGPERLRSLGSLLGASGGTDTLHYLLERDPSSWAFRYDLGQLLAFGGRFPLYAVIHESCWADGGVTDWAAARVRPAAFDQDPTLLTGEHVRPELFSEDATLRPWREVAELVAQQEWPGLYDPSRLAAGGVRGAAAVYARDVYVPMETSLATAALMPGLRTWVTSEYEHNGSRASGGEVFRRLRDLASGVVVR